MFLCPLALAAAGDRLFLSVIGRSHSPSRTLLRPSRQRPLFTRKLPFNPRSRNQPRTAAMGRFLPAATL